METARTHNPVYALLKRCQNSIRKQKGEKERKSVITVLCNCIIYNNINGLISKQDSLVDILNMRKPDLIALCETKLHVNSTFEIKGYKVVKSNLKAGKEGILVAAKEGTYNKIELIYEADSKQLATVEINYPNNNIRLTVVHGPQEDADIEEREEFYVDLHAELQRGLESQCQVLLVGDFNARLVHEEGQLQESQGNGKRLKEVVEKFNLNVLNIQPSTEGKWKKSRRKAAYNVNQKSIV